MVQFVKLDRAGFFDAREAGLILTVTPNVALDKTYRVEGFAINCVNRPSLTYTVAGGKGVNVARVYQTLGGTAWATGFLGGPNGRIVAQALKREGIASDFAPTRGECRLCIAVIDPMTGAQTEINEAGPKVAPREVAELLRRIERLFTQHEFEFVVLSGSLPPNAPDTLYAEIMALARKANVRVVLDSSGAALRAGIAARPWMVKPNRVELEGALERPLRDETDVLQAARHLHSEGVEIVVVTLGAAGAMLICPSGAWRAVPPPIEFVSAVASGDSFLAAFLWAWSHGATPRDPASALRLAVGAGAANAAVIGAGFCTRDAIFALAQNVVVEKLDS